jgi:hypothetical protein
VAEVNALVNDPQLAAAIHTQVINGPAGGSIRGPPSAADELANELSSLVIERPLVSLLPPRKDLYDRDAAFKVALVAWKDNRSHILQGSKGKPCFTYLVAFGLQGSGKTEIGAQICHRLLEDPSRPHVLYVCIDFSNGDKLDLEERQLSSSRDVDVLLGRRVLSRFFGARDLNLYWKLRKCNVSFAAALECVARSYREDRKLAPDVEVTICVHLDEYEAVGKDLARALAAVPGSFFLARADEASSAAQRSRVILLPVLTGLTRDACFNQEAVSLFSVGYLPVPALTEESVDRILTPVVSRVTLQRPRFRRILRCLAGNPRAVVDFLPAAVRDLAHTAALAISPALVASPAPAPVVKLPVFLSDDRCQELGERLESKLTAAQRDYDLAAAFGSTAAMRTFLVLAITSHPFPASAEVFGKMRWLDIERYQLATAVEVEGTPLVQLLLPHWLLRQALRQAASMSLCYSSVLAPLGGEFDWKSFERLFVHLLACRVLALLRCEPLLRCEEADASSLAVTLGQLFPGAQMSKGLPETRVLINEIRVEKRAEPLVEKVQGQLSLALPGLETGIIWLEKPGNELVDAATCFAAASDSRTLRRCFIQAKFSGETTIDPKQRYPELRKVVNEMFKVDANCIPVFVTNRKTPLEHVAFLQQQRQFVLYDFNTIKQFLGRSLHPLVPCAEFE